MFGLGVGELALIAVLVGLLFGPSQVPKMGKALGESIKEFRKAGKALVEEPGSDEEA